MYSRITIYLSLQSERVWLTSRETEKVWGLRWVMTSPSPATAACPTPGRPLSTASSGTGTTGSSSDTFQQVRKKMLLRKLLEKGKTPTNIYTICDKSAVFIQQTRDSAIKWQYAWKTDKLYIIKSEMGEGRGRRRVCTNFTDISFVTVLCCI